MSLKYWSWWLYPIPQEREGFAAAAFKKTDKAAACGLPVDLHLVITKASSTATSSMEGQFTAKFEQSVIPGEGTDVDREVIAVVGAGGNGSTG